MKNGDATLWTIEELGERVAAELSAGYGGVPSGRVRDVPDLRTIRYYTTLGLLDRPAEMRGRTALYGDRHLHQLVAIKRLQAKGLSLTEVQRRVVGLSDRALRRLAEAEPFHRKEAATARSRPQDLSPRAESFWRIPPDEDRADEIDQVEEPARSPPPSPSEDDLDVHTVISLGQGLSLSLVTGRVLDNEDLGVIRMAAAPLIELLKLRGLIGPARK